MGNHPAPDTPPADAARAVLHAWLDACDEELVLALWQMVYWLERPVGRREE